jgi:hypothetical protein
MFEDLTGTKCQRIPDPDLPDLRYELAIPNCESGSLLFLTPKEMSGKMFLSLLI